MAEPAFAGRLSERYLVPDCTDALFDFQVRAA
jgi:hypothetical protein